jgi:hypothetical protein
VGAAVAGLIAAVLFLRGHVCSIGVMHPDVRPFMPWTDYNPFLGLIGPAPLHLACIASAALGAVGVALRKRRSKGSST